MKRKSSTIIPNVVRGGIAIPLGNNYFYMKGRKHTNGGIDIGNNPRTGLEVEGEEIVHTSPKELKVYSSVPFLNGKSPAEKVLDGENPNKVFNEQQRYKRVNKLNDDGTKAEFGDWKETTKEIASYLPVVGTVMDGYEFYKNPNWKTALNLGISVGSDILGAKLVKGAGKLAVKQLLSKGGNKAFTGVKAAKRTKIMGEIANEAVNTGVNYVQQNYDEKAMGGNTNKAENGKDEKLKKNIADQTISPTNDFIPYYQQENINNISKLNSIIENGKKFDINTFRINAFNKTIDNINNDKNKNIEAVNKYKINNDAANKLDEEANKYLIDYDETNEVKFTSGRYNTGKVSTKILDSIYDAAIEAKMNPLELLAVAGRESTFGIGRGYKKGNPISMTKLMSNWQQVQPYTIPARLTNEYNAIISKILEKGESSLTKDDIDKINKYKEEDKKSADSTRKITENPIVNAAKYYMSGKYNPGDKDYHNKILKEMETLKADKGFMNWYNSRSKKTMGGLNRNKDFGSDKRPYPNVSKNDFAGKDRSYPIPTKADAVDALRLAGLHGRNDIRAKVLSRYPELRQKAKRGGIYTVNIGGVEHLKSTSFTGEDTKRKKGTLGTISELPELEIPNIEDSNIKIKEDKFVPLKDNLKVKPMSIGSYKPYTTEDFIGAGSNLIGNISSYFINNKMLKNLKSPSQPVARQANKLKTNVNINPQLDTIRENVSSSERDIEGNTASSRIALARKQRIRNAGQQQINQLYGTKENTETQLINKDRLNQQEVTNKNIEDYNKYRDADTAFRNAITEKKAENAIDLVSGINNSMQDLISRREKRESDRQTILAMVAAHPNVNPRILRDLGIKGITDTDIANWDKAFGRK